MSSLPHCLLLFVLVIAWCDHGASFEIITLATGGEPQNFTVPAGETTYFDYKPANTVGVSTYALRITLEVLSDNQNSLQAFLQSCRVPNSDFLVSQGGAIDSCTAENGQTCFFFVPPCEYSDNTYFISVAETGNDDPIQFQVVVVEEDLDNTVQNITHRDILNGNVTFGEYRVYGPVAGFADGVIDVTLIPDQGNNGQVIQMFIGDNTFPGKTCNVLQCTATSGPCNVILSTSCGISATSYFIGILTPGTARAHYKLALSAQSQPPVIDLGDSPTTVTASVAAYQTQYFLYRRDATFTDEDRLTVVASDLVNNAADTLVLSVSDFGPPGTQCTLATCTTAISCSEAVERCQTGEDIVFFGVKALILEEDSLLNFTLQVLENDRTTVNLNYGVSAEYRFTPGANRAYFQLPSPTTAQPGSSVWFRAFDMNEGNGGAQIRVDYSREYLATFGACRDGRTLCDLAGDVSFCSGNIPLCAFREQTGDIYVSIEGMNPATFNFTSVVKIVEPQFIAIDGQVKVYNSSESQLHIFNVLNATTSSTLQITMTDLSDNAQFELRLVSIVDGCKVPLGLPCTTSVCNLEINCAPVDMLIEITNRLNEVGSFSIEMQVVDDSIPLPVGTTLIEEFQEAGTKRFSFLSPSEGAIKVDIGSVAGTTVTARLLYNCAQRSTVTCLDSCSLIITDEARADAGIWVVEVLTGTPNNVSLHASLGMDTCVSGNDILLSAPFCTSLPTTGMYSIYSTLGEMAGNADSAISALDILYAGACLDTTAEFACDFTFRPCPVDGLRALPCKQDCLGLIERCGANSCVVDECNLLDDCPVPPPTENTSTEPVVGNASTLGIQFALVGSLALFTM